MKIVKLYRIAFVITLTIKSLCINLVMYLSMNILTNTNIVTESTTILCVVLRKINVRLETNSEGVISIKVKGELLDDYVSELNDNDYYKGQMVAVTELEGFPNDYAIYRYGGLDWIPKRLIKSKFDHKTTQMIHKEKE